MEEASVSKKSNRIEFKRRKIEQIKDVADIERKRFMICIGHADRKAFLVETACKKSFPESDTLLLYSLAQRYKLVEATGTMINLYWSFNLKGKPIVINAIFFKFAEDKFTADRWIKKISARLDRLDARSDTLSQDTKVLSNNSENEQDDCLSSFDAAKEIMKNRKREGHMLDYSNKGQEKPCTEDGMRVVLKEFKDELKEELIVEMKRFLDGKGYNNVADISRTIDEKYEQLVENGEKLNKHVQKLSNMLDPKNLKLKDIQRKATLFAADEFLPLGTTRQIDLRGVVNRIYRQSGDNHMKFVRSMVQTLYGDILCFFKFDVERVYKDPGRTTRRPIEELDPTGLNLMQKIIEHYHEKHANEVVEQKTNINLASEEFIPLMMKVIDVWGNKAFCKNGRSKPSIDCILRTQLLSGHCLREDDSQDEIHELLQMYEQCKRKGTNSTPTTRKKINRIALKDRNESLNDEPDTEDFMITAEIE